MALPPIEDFLAVGFSREFRGREVFEAWADQLHDALLAARGIDEGEHIQKHQHHLRKFLRQCHQREATEGARRCGEDAAVPRCDASL